MGLGRPCFSTYFFFPSTFCILLDSRWKAASHHHLHVVLAAGHLGRTKRNSKTERCVREAFPTDGVSRRGTVNRGGSKRRPADAMCHARRARGRSGPWPLDGARRGPAPPRTARRSERRRETLVSRDFSVNADEKLKTEKAPPSGTNDDRGDTARGAVAAR